MRTLIAAITLALLGTPAVARSMSDTEIRQAVVQDSIASYPGQCPCPYSAMRNGAACGGRSAYSRPGGYAPICYSSDVSEGMVQTYRRGHEE